MAHNILMVAMAFYPGDLGTWLGSSFFLEGMFGCSLSFYLVTLEEMTNKTGK
jgi:hypothetical protein